MLIKESEYLKELLELLPKEKLKVLNFGSQSKEYIKRQPHINKNIILPILQKGHTLFNVDIVEMEGVDLVGDIFDDEFYSKLIKKDFDVILVFNLLEHVNDISLMVEKIQGIIPKGKFIIFSGPFSYPKHYDPIDNLFRPDIEEVTKLFNKCVLIKGKKVKDFKYIKYLILFPTSFISLILRTFAFFYKYDKWKNIIIPKYMWLFKNFETTCVLFRKTKD